MFRTMSLLLTSIFIGVGIFSFSKTIDLSQQNTKLSTEIERTLKPRLAQLEQEATRLRTENTQMKEDKAVLEEELAKAQGDLESMSEKNDALRQKVELTQTKLKQNEAIVAEKNRYLSQLLSKYKTLLAEHDAMKEKFDAMFVELVQMRKKYAPRRYFNTLSENSKTSEKKNRKIQPPQPTVEQNVVAKAETAPAPQPKSDQTQVIVGNGGYLMKDGRNTFVPKARIRVLTVE